MSGVLGSILGDTKVNTQFQRGGGKGKEKEQERGREGERIKFAIVAIKSLGSVVT